MADDDFERTEEASQRVIRASQLMLNTREGVSGKRVAPVLLMGSNYFFSPQIKLLLDDIEPGVHRFFEVRVASKLPVGGKTDHGTYYWLRPPPVVDCLLFPQTKTRSDLKGNAWDKTPRYKALGLPFQWGGGVAFSYPAYVDGAKIEGHHFWLTRQGPGQRLSTHLMTWSHALLQEYLRRQLNGWRVSNEFNIVY